MFNNERVTNLEAELAKLIRKLKDNEVLGHSGPPTYGHAPNNNRKLARNIKELFNDLREHEQLLAALMKYLNVEYVEESGKKIREKIDPK